MWTVLLLQLSKVVTVDDGSRVGRNESLPGVAARDNTQV